MLTRLQTLLADLLDALDAAQDQSLQNRDVLIRIYKDFTDERPVDPDAPPASGGTPRRPRELGQPVDLNLKSHGDPLASVVKRLERAGAPLRPVSRVRRAMDRFDHVLSSYAAGLYEKSTPSAWRSVVEKAYTDVVTCIGDAEREVKAWAEEEGQAQGPDVRTLNGKDMLFAEDFVELYRGELKIDAARKLLSSGKVGTPFVIGKRNAVLKDDMFATLARSAADDKSPRRRGSVAAMLDALPRRRRGQGPRKKKGKDPTPPV